MHLERHGHAVRSAIGAVLTIACMIPAARSMAAGDAVSTRQIHSDAIARPNFDLRRVFCMDGSAAHNIAASFDPDLRPDVGEYCMLNLEHSADTEQDPAALQQRPDKALLAPYQRLAREKGFRGEQDDGRAVLAALSGLARDARAGSTVGPVRQPLSNGQALVLVPGVAWDAGFTSTLLEAPSTGKATRPYQVLVGEAARCFTNTQAYIQACYEGGVQQARTYLSARRSRTRPPPS